MQTLSLYEFARLDMMRPAFSVPALSPADAWDSLASHLFTRYAAQDIDSPEFQNLESIDSYYFTGTQTPLN